MGIERTERWVKKILKQVCGNCKLADGGRESDKFREFPAAAKRVVAGSEEKVYSQVLMTNKAASNRSKLFLCWFITSGVLECGKFKTFPSPTLPFRVSFRFRFSGWLFRFTTQLLCHNIERFKHSGLVCGACSLFSINDRNFCSGKKRIGKKYWINSRIKFEANICQLFYTLVPSLPFRINKYTTQIEFISFPILVWLMVFNSSVTINKCFLC